MVANRAQFFNQSSTTALLCHPYLNELFMLQLLLKTAYVCLLADLNKFPYVLGLEKNEAFYSVLYSHQCEKYKSLSLL